MVTSSNCVRCGMAVPFGEVHIFHGGEERKERLEHTLGTKVSLCLKPLKVVKEILCSCGRYCFDFDIPCPACGATYIEVSAQS